MRTRKTIKITRTDISAVGAGLGSHVRVDKNNHLSFSFSFVLDKTLKLKEVPMIEPSVQSLAHKLIPALSYSFKVLQNDCISRGNNFLADVVVYPTHITFLTARDCFKLSDGRLCAFTLEFSPQILVLDNLCFVTSENFTITTDGKVIYSEVNTEISVATESAGVFNRCHGLLQVPSDLYRECNVKEHLSFSIFHNLKRLVSPVEILPVIFRNVDRNILSFTFDKSSKANLIKGEGKQVSIETNRARLHNGLLFKLSRFKILRSLSNSFTGKVSRKPLSQIFIDEMMEFVPIANFGFKSFVNSVLDSFKKCVRHFNQLFIQIYLNLYCGNGFHNPSTDTNLYLNVTEVTGSIHPTA